MRSSARIAGVAALGLLLSACTSTRIGTDRLAEKDPLEGFNRAVFSVNRGADKILVKPVTQVYRGVTPKPARDVRPGDMLEISLGPVRWTVVVRQLNEQRRPAIEAQLLYDETEESRARRSVQRENLRLAPAPGSDLRGRPTKKARRLIHRFTES